MANYQVVNGVKTLNMHGKNYVEVAERVNQVHEAKAEFDIVKSEPMQVADRWLWVSIIKINGHQYMGNAEIKMNAAKNTPDGTNPFECAETSAIGRALGFAGFGSVESIASKDEIERGKPFNGAQEESKPAEKPAQAASIPQASREQWEQIHALCEQLKIDMPATSYNIHQAKNVIARLQKRVDDQKSEENEVKPAEKPASAHLTYQSVYKAGKEKGLWNAANGFYAFAAHVIGGNVNEATIKNIAAPNLEKLMKAIEAEKPLAKAS